MTKAWAWTVIMAGLSATAVSAQEFKGADLSAEVLGFSNGDDITNTTYQGGAEMGFGSFGAAAEFSSYDFGNIGGRAERNLTLHGVYDGMGFATFGAFLAHDFNGGDSANSVGVEAKSSFGPIGVEGYAGLGSRDGDGFRLLGIDGSYDVSGNIYATASANLLNEDGGTVGRLALGGVYRVGQGPSIYGQIGRVVASDGGKDISNSGTYLGVGVRIAIGRNDGTTFRSRGVFESISGM